MKKFSSNPYSPLSFEDQLILQEAMEREPIVFVFDKITKEQFRKIVHSTENLEGLEESSVSIDRDVYKISFTVKRNQPRAIDKIVSLQEEIFPELFKAH